MTEIKKPKLSLQIEKPKEDTPRDVFGLVYILFFLLGIVHALPITFFVTAHDYWMYKFRNTSFTEIDSEHRTYLQKILSPGLTIAMNVSSVIILFLTLLLGHNFTQKVKFYGSFCGNIVFLIILAIFIHIDTDDWQIGFFVLTMFLVVCINAMTSIYGMALFSVISCFSKDSLGAYLNGQGMASIFTSCLQVLSLAVGISTKKSALVYFWLVIGLIVFCLCFMLAVEKHNNFFKFYYKINIGQNLEEKQERKKVTISEIFYIVKYTWPSLALCVTLLITLNPLHPSITSLVVSEGEGNGDWNDVYFVPVIIFVLPAFCELLGRVISFKFQPDVNILWIIGFSVMRIFIFIPLIMLCNAQPREHLPVVFTHDYQFIVIMIVFSTTNGYFISTGQLIVQKVVPPELLERAYHVNMVLIGVIIASLCFLSFISVDFL